MGHVDIKFNLHPMCTSPPDVQVTLLKQNITSLGRQSNSPHPVDVDKGVDFSISTDSASVEPEPSTSDEGTSQGREGGGNNVLDPRFQERHNAEILCGPVSVASCLDLSGNGGLITLASPQLLASKPKAIPPTRQGIP